MKKTLFLVAALAAAVMMSGCASTDYDRYAQIHIEKSKTEATRYDALDSVARHATDPTVKVAAAMALAFAGQGQTSAIGVAPPQNATLEFFKTLLGAGVQGYGIWAGTVSNVVNSTKGAADKDVAGQALQVLTPNLTGSTGK